MSPWLTTWAQAPLSARHRGHLAPLAIALLAGATAALVLSAPKPQRSPARVALTATAPPRPTSASINPAAVSATALSPALERVSRVFLSGYLAYLYGHGSAMQIRDVSGPLLAALEGELPRVSSAIRARQPRVLSLTRIPAPSGLAGVSVLINDGSVVDYRIELLLQDRGTALVSSVGAGWSR